MLFTSCFKVSSEEILGEYEDPAPSPLEVIAKAESTRTAEIHPAVGQIEFPPPTPPVINNTSAQLVDCKEIIPAVLSIAFNTVKTSNGAYVQAEYSFIIDRNGVTKNKRDGITKDELGSHKEWAIGSNYEYTHSDEENLYVVTRELKGGKTIALVINTLNDMEVISLGYDGILHVSNLPGQATNCTHTVKDGQNFEWIANKYGITVEDLKAMNKGLKNYAVIQPNQVIRICYEK